MARLKLELFGTPSDELASTVDGDVPDWIESLYLSYGTTSERAPASASVLALAESLGYRLQALRPASKDGVAGLDHRAGYPPPDREH